MVIDSIDTLLAVLRRTQLLAQDQIDEVRRELVPSFRDSNALGEYLVSIDWLTSYQLQLLLGGHWDDLNVGPYQILDRLGEGGISEVFKAWDTARGRVVALKVLRQHLASNADMLKQFQRELLAVTRLSHPNIIKTFDAQRDGERHYFAMEFVEGMDLERYVREVGPLSVEQTVDYVRQVAQGLQHAHQSGLVHRDIKPANVFLLHPPLPSTHPPGKRMPDPVVKVIDWGLARLIRDQGDTVSAADGQDAEKGSLIGTIDYIAPEQATDATLVDIRADIYSLGCVAYFLLTGRPPYQGGSLMQKLLQHQEAPVPSVVVERPDVPPELDELVRKMLAKHPEQRPQIPLLVVASLRQLATRLCAGAAVLRPGSALHLPSLPPMRGVAPGTALNLPRPGTSMNLPRPGTSLNLPRPGANGAH